MYVFFYIEISVGPPQKHTHTLLTFYGSFFIFQSNGWQVLCNLALNCESTSSPSSSHPEESLKRRDKLFSVLQVSNHIYSIYICIVYKVVVTLATTTRCLISAAKATAETRTYLWILRIFTQIHIRSDMNYLFLHVTLMQIALLDCCVGF